MAPWSASVVTLEYTRKPPFFKKIRQKYPPERCNLLTGGGGGGLRENSWRA